MLEGMRLDEYALCILIAAEPVASPAWGIDRVLPLGLPYDSAPVPLTRRARQAGLESEV
jgi:hypothetical protein